jgi:tetraacyldisaccharide 4'-kinase
LLARAAPTWIARDRKDGARAAIAEGVDTIVLDDGLQNPALRYAASLVVVDAGYGFGNRRLLPAGPLRERIDDGLARATAIVLIGDDAHGLGRELQRHAPVLHAHLVPDDAALALKGRRVFAFAGIGRPEKFFDTLAALGATIVDRVAFADHHPYTADDAMRVVEDAQRRDAVPVTTTKDFVRLPEGSQRLVTPVGVSLLFDEPGRLDDILKAACRGR